MKIETVDADRIGEVLPLIRLYQTFYQVANIDDAHNEAFFRQFGPENPAGCLFLCRDSEGTAVAFATVYFTYSSTLAAKVGVMNDLFTLPEYRGRGIGAALIRHCLSFVLSRGAARLQWATAMDNHTAQRVYNALGANAKPWLFYTWQGA